MKQIFENLKDGKIEMLNVPVSNVGSGKILVKNYYSLISSGTERSMLEFGSKGLLAKAKSRPDLVKQVLEKVKSEGLLTTYKKAMHKLEDFLPLGYSSAGEVIEVGKYVDEFHKGDLVACAGGGYATHSEYVVIPKNLAVKIPQGVSPEEASFVTLGSIAMQGVRQSGAVVGDTAAVIGLGLVGLLTIQILKSAGCRVIGMDVNPNKKDIAEELGVDLFVDLSDGEPVGETMDFTMGRGVDVVLMTASTKSNAPVELTPQIIRDRGTFVIVGVSKIDIPRTPYYKKEITVKFSRSYGPGRYDPVYEERGIDYPIGYVKWTEKRNMEAFISLIAENKINVKPLISYEFPIEEYEKAYNIISGKEKSDKPVIAILFKYDRNSKDIKRTINLKNEYEKPTDKIGISVIGAGNFTKSTLMPNLLKLKDKISLRGVSSYGGSSAAILAKKYSFAYSTSDYEKVAGDSYTDLVFITVPHNLHVPIAKELLKDSKDVFVEKPLAINIEQLKEIIKIRQDSGKRVMVGFNRRFSPLTQWERKQLGSQIPRIITYRVNAGPVPVDHWINDPNVGGGRIIGEVCHFIDYLIYMFGSYPTEVYGKCANIDNKEFLSIDNCIFTLEFENGSIGNIIYESIGDKVFPKERIEIYANNFVGAIDNFVRAETYKGNKIYRKKLLEQDKGFVNEYKEVISALRKGSDFPIDFNDIVYTTLTTFALKEVVQTGKPIKIKEFMKKEGIDI
jgi:predicted dehydrogenase/threonine dehydrogenase-like Zn-dependent dehydrogenase